MRNKMVEQDSLSTAKPSADKTDFLAGGVIIAAIVMFVGNGSAVMSNVVRAVTGQGFGVDNVMTTIILLNISIIIFGWGRYKELSTELQFRKVSEQDAKTLAATDPLTGLLNRRTIVEQTSDMMTRARRLNQSIAFLTLDLDNFKNVNDVHGHNAGDIVLKTAAKNIAAVLPPRSLMARLGGDEFACAFIYNSDQPDTVIRITEDIIENVSTPLTEAGMHVVVTTSIGIAQDEEAARSVDTLMRQSDIAMYASKKQGRNRYCWFDHSMEQELQVRNSMESGIRAGVPAGEFVPYFEQQVDLITGCITGFEMLARWESPANGLVSPEIFIPIAEETGIIGDLSMSVMRQAFSEAKNWDEQLTLSVNVSPTQLLDPWLAQKIVKLLVETGFPATRLEVEITESSLFENLNLAQSIVGSLKNQGIKIALDDFGTGYSSLAHLRALPFDRIKIDRSFVTSVKASQENAAIVNAISGLGENLSLPITAEGIEDKEVADHMRTIGCTKGQGWYFGKPMAIAQTRKLLAERDLLPQQRNENRGNVHLQKYG